MNKKCNTKQDGVILISCLIFLILILGLLRISVGSSQITEKKSGIDSDLLNAKEAAETAMRQAAASFLPPLSNFAQCAAPNQNSDSCKVARMLEAKRYWSDPANLNLNGRYDGTTQNGDCGPGTTDNRPLWQCVDWGNEFHKSYGVGQNLSSVSFGRGAYIIESFPAAEMGVTSSLGSNSIMLRVTAVGIGQPSPGGNPTNVMLQADYIIQ